MAGGDLVLDLARSRTPSTPLDLTPAVEVAKSDSLLESGRRSVNGIPVCN